MRCHLAADGGSGPAKVVSISAAGGAPASEAAARELILQSPLEPRRRLLIRPTDRAATLEVFDVVAAVEAVMAASGRDQGVQPGALPPLRLPRQFDVGRHRHPGVIGGMKQQDRGQGVPGFNRCPKGLQRTGGRVISRQGRMPPTRGGDGRIEGLQAAHPLRSAQQSAFGRRDPVGILQGQLAQAPQHPTAIQPVARPVELIRALDQIQRAADARQAIEQGLLQLGIEQHRAPQGEPHPKQGQ